MSLLKRLFKPAWQSTNTDRRATAVQTLRDPELISALPNIATQDADASVRRVAMLRMNDLGLYADRSRHDNDQKLRGDARKRFINGLLDADQQRAAEAERLLRVEEDLSVIEAVARGAKQATLRRLALEKLDRPGLLADCALSDADADIRLWLVNRIDTDSALKRVVEQSRKSDKRVYRAATARLEQRALESGDGLARRQHALDLCTRLEGLLHALPADASAQLIAIRADWAGNSDPLDQATKTRVDGLINALDGALRAIEAGPSTPAETEAAIVDEAETVTEAATEPDSDITEEEPTRAEPEPAPIDPRLAELNAQLAAADDSDDSDLTALGTQISELSAELELDQRSTDELQRKLRHAQNARRERARDAVSVQASELIEQLQRATTEQKAGDARAALSALEAIRAANQGLPRALRPAFTEAKAEVRKLLDWQHWSNNEIRRRLCDDLEAIPAAGLHPDAVAARVKELQTEWRRIDALEGIDPKAPARGLGKRFNALVFQVLKPARPYFEKRAELRRERGEALEQATTGIEEQLALAKDRKAILALRRSLVDSLRELNDIDPRQRKAMGQRLRTDLSAVDARLAEQTEQVELAKRRLIAELRRDLEALPAEEHADRAKQAQSRWRGLGIGERKRDQAQWKELRELVDPVFEQVAGQLQVEQEQNQAQRDAIDQLVVRLQAGIEDEQATADSLQRLQQQVRDETAELGTLDRQLERRIDEAMRQVDQRAEERVRHERLSAYTALATRSSRLDRIEAAWIDGSGLDQTALHELIEVEPLSNSALQAALELRRQRLVDLSGDSDEADMAQVLNLLEAQQREAELLLLDCEFFAGQDSPEAFQSQRMDLQVKRLAERMAGGEAAIASVQAANLWAAWFSIGPLSSASRESLTARFNACREALEGALQ